MYKIAGDSVMRFGVANQSVLLQSDSTLTMQSGNTGLILNNASTYNQTVFYLPNTTSNCTNIRATNSSNQGLYIRGDGYITLTTPNDAGIAMGAGSHIGFGDTSKGIGYSGVNSPGYKWNGTYPNDGTVVYGWTDGALGTVAYGTSVVLYWNTTQVGINNTSPSYTLDVTGNCRSSGGFYLNIPYYGVLGGLGYPTAPIYTMPTTNMSGKISALLHGDAGYGNPTYIKSYFYNYTCSVSGTVYQGFTPIVSQIGSANAGLTMSGNVIYLNTTGPGNMNYTVEITV